ncbi:MAG: hypothetical protein H0T76_24745 [Nannocystis sp.]|nr:hypothetical protein [Nannocystis sp.]MBA3549700.1 hypothetical protein [Nannocystis sp.]
MRPHRPEPHARHVRMVPACLAALMALSLAGTARASATTATTATTSATPEPATTSAPPEPATPEPATSTVTTEPAPTATAVTPAPVSARVAEISPPLPRLTLSAGFIFGPHAKGEADCQSVDGGYECRHHGDFLGAGATIELRGQLYKLLYLHVRGLMVGNLRKRPRAVHSGLAGAGIGLGAYSRLAFVRAEYLLVPTLGGDQYVPPFYDKPEARDDYGLHAAMISAGVHKYVSPRVAIEGWAGLVVGPSSKRRTVNTQADEDRVLVSFMLNLGLTFDVLLAKGYRPPPKAPRQRRQW